MPRHMWVQKQNIGPAKRSRHVMAFDEKSGRVILFGGLTGKRSGAALTPHTLNDTWSWDGTFWTQVSDMGPWYPNPFELSRRSLAMTFDAKRGQIVLYTEGASWLWDGKYWWQAADTGPVVQYAESEISLAFMPASAMVFAHGNQEIGTWSWDGVKWLQVADTGPSGGLQALSFDPQRKRLILFEGESGVTWEFDGEAWQGLSSVGPGRGVDLKVASDGIHVVGFAVQQGQGGRVEPRGTWLWSDSHWKQIENMGPAARIDAALSGNTATHAIILHGGSELAGGGDVLFADTWECAETGP